MSTKGGNFFEEHVEKMVLAVAGLLCLWVLVTRAILSPNTVSFGQKKFVPGKIDYHISEKAELLETKLSLKAKPKPPPEERLGEFVAAMGSPLGAIDVSLVLPLPKHSLRDFSDNRKYRIPQVVEIGPASVEHIRAVAYFPTGEISSENIYGKDNTEPNDIDFVTVQSEINVGELVKNFYESFAGGDVREEWRDPCLANPVFAAVQLQRQDLLSDGSWSSWQTVPRTKIDHRKKMFEVIEDAEKLPAGGIQVRLLRFDDQQVMMNLLQPEAYVIASAEEEWFPPSLHKEYAKYLKEVEAKEKREAREAERKKREEERERRREERFGTRGGTMSNPGRISRTYEGSEDRTGFSAGSTFGRLVRTRGLRGERGFGSPARRGRPLTDRAREEFAAQKKYTETGKKASDTKTVSYFYDEYDKILITEETDIAKMSKPLVFWAHDDTVEPGKSYQYRIRLGVFNPIAGTDRVMEQDKLQKNSVILWSNFSGNTKIVKVPARLYFFPHRMQEVAEIVTVKVCRYVFGYWYSKDFRVKQGEVIGKAVKPEPAKEEEQEEDKSEEFTIPKTIDYSTGAIYVDAIPIDNWGGGKNIHRRPYYDMLYSFDGTQIEHIPVNRSYWDEELQSKFSEIEGLEERPKKALRDWRSRTTRYKYTRRRPRADEDRTKVTKKPERKKDRRKSSEEEAFKKMMEKRMGLR